MGILPRRLVEKQPPQRRRCLVCLLIGFAFIFQGPLREKKKTGTMPIVVVVVWWNWGVVVLIKIKKQHLFFMVVVVGGVEEENGRRDKSNVERLRFSSLLRECWWHFLHGNREDLLASPFGEQPAGHNEIDQTHFCQRDPPLNFLKIILVMRLKTIFFF